MKKVLFYVVYFVAGVLVIFADNILIISASKMEKINKAFDWFENLTI